MSHTIVVSDRLYKKAEQLAHESAQPIDDLISNYLEVAFESVLPHLPLEERDEIAAMNYLSDDALFTMMHEQMPKDIQERIITLLSNNTHGRITDSEYAELEDLVERSDKLTLRKSQAMKYLIERGHVIGLIDLKLSHE